MGFDSDKRVNSIKEKGIPEYENFFFDFFIL